MLNKSHGPAMCEFTDDDGKKQKGWSTFTTTKSAFRQLETFVSSNAEQDT